MNDVNELRRFAVLHSRAQRIPERVLHTVLARVRDDDTGPTSWTAAWSQQGQYADQAGDHRLSGACYGLARFPYVDGPARAAASARCLSAFDRWRARYPSMQRRTVDRPDGSFSYYLQPPRRPGRPLLVVLGGIVSHKEQWAPLLPSARRMGFGVAVTELPGVGENTTRYEPTSWHQLGALLDDAAHKVDTDQCFVAGLSFGGHLALTAALHDRRIHGVVTVGAPLTRFFTAGWWPHLPAITRATLSHLTKMPEADLPGLLGQWALSPSDLSRLTMPVRYVASSQDEIIPPDDVTDLLRWAPDARCKRFDDVHGAPDHTTAIRIYLMRHLLGMSLRLRSLRARAEPVPVPRPGAPR